jgi:GTPase
MNNDEIDEIDEIVEKHCGYVAFIGRPNAGKSTLLNRLVGEKIAAVSDKPQTTRTQIRGVLSLPAGQIVFVDTPGVHKPGYKLNKRMMHAVLDAVEQVDLLVLLRDVSVPMGQGEKYVLSMIKEAQRPTVLLLNKIDRLKDKSALLPIIDFYRQEFDFCEVLPISALKGDNLDRLTTALLRHLPVGTPIFEEDTLTDRPIRTIAAELVREKILQATAEELPFATAVVCERWEEDPAGRVNVYCAIYVERDSQRPIIIGRGGQRLKQIGTAARRDIRRLVGQPIHLELFVKVHPDWRNDERVLDELGIVESK